MTAKQLNLIALGVASATLGIGFARLRVSVNQHDIIAVLVDGEALEREYLENVQRAWDDATYSDEDEDA